jgi:small subunit ribosomal protein S21
MCYIFRKVTTFFPFHQIILVKILLKCKKKLVVSKKNRIFAVQKRKVIHLNERKQVFSMIIVPLKEGENIDRGLKKFKRKFEKTGVIKELRRRKQFEKPSVTARAQRKKAIYVQQLRDAAEASMM